MIAIIAVLISLLLPAVQKVRESASRTQCINNMKQLGLALHNYHDANKVFPFGQSDLMAVNGFAAGITPQPFHDNSWMPSLLPYIEQDNLYKIFSPYLAAGTTNAMSWPSNQTVVRSLLCPSDPNYGNPKTSYASGAYPGLFGNYVLCSGNRYYSNTGLSTGSGDGGITANGMFYPQSKTRIADVTDGLTNTLMASELIVVPNGNGDTSACSLGGQYDYRGGYFAALCGGTLFQTINSPNSSVGDYVWNACTTHPAGSSNPVAPCRGLLGRHGHFPGSFRPQLPPWRRQRRPRRRRAASSRIT